MAYVPDATDPEEPTESRTVESAALEFRTIKAYYMRALQFPSTNGMGTLPGVTARQGRVLAFAPGTGVPIAGPSTAELLASVQTAEAAAISATHSASLAEAALANLNEKYLGPRATAPTTNAAGAPLSAADNGLQYFDTTLATMRTYLHPQWRTPSGLVASVAGKVGDVLLTQADVGGVDGFSVPYRGSAGSGAAVDSLLVATNAASPLTVPRRTAEGNLIVAPASAPTHAVSLEQFAAFQAYVEEQIASIGGGWLPHIFLESDTFDLEEGKTYYIFGGGAGGSGGSRGNQNRATGGNGGGIAARTYIPAANEELTIVVGAGGNGVLGNNSGNAGGDTIITGPTFGTMTCPGGQGGQRSNSNITPPDPPMPTGGDVNYPGGRAGANTATNSITGGGSVFGINAENQGTTNAFGALTLSGVQSQVEYYTGINAPPRGLPAPMYSVLAVLPNLGMVPPAPQIVFVMTSVAQPPAEPSPGGFFRLRPNCTPGLCAGGSGVAANSTTESTSAVLRAGSGVAVILEAI